MTSKCPIWKSVLNNGGFGIITVVIFVAIFRPIKSPDALYVSVIYDIIIGGISALAMLMLAIQNLNLKTVRSYFIAISGAIVIGLVVSFALIWHHESQYGIYSDHAVMPVENT